MDEIKETVVQQLNESAEVKQKGARPLFEKGDLCLIK